MAPHRRHGHSWKHFFFWFDTILLHLLISAPSLGVYYFLSLTLPIRLSVCLHTHCFFFFVSRWNRAIFWPSVLHDKNHKTFSSIFHLGPLTPKIYSPKFSSVGHWVRHSLWVIICGSTTFGLGVEIQMPTGLFYLLTYLYVMPQSQKQNLVANLQQMRRKCGAGCDQSVPGRAQQNADQGSATQTLCCWHR